MRFELLGWPADSPRLDLDHELFAYAGNFRTGRTGIAVASARGGDVVAAVSFDEDRAVGDALRIRYVTVREDRRGERIGPRLLAFLRGRVLAEDPQRAHGSARSDRDERTVQRLRIGVNNPIAYQAAYRAGFGFTGDESGMGELVLEAPPPAERSPARYRDGLARFADRDLPPAQRAVLDRRGDGEPPAVVASTD